MGIKNPLLVMLEIIVVHLGLETESVSKLVVHLQKLMKRVFGVKCHP